MLALALDRDDCEDLSGWRWRLGLAMGEAEIPIVFNSY